MLLNVQPVQSVQSVKTVTIPEAPPRYVPTAAARSVSTVPSAVQSADLEASILSEGQHVSGSSMM